jgi:tellurite resistance protein TerC
MYFLLVDLKDKFDYLQTGLAVILAFVGVKMIINEWVEIPTFVGLLVIGGVLAVSIIASIKLNRPDDHGPDEVLDDHTGDGLEMFREGNQD